MDNLRDESASFPTVVVGYTDVKPPYIYSR